MAKQIIVLALLFFAAAVGFASAAAPAPSVPPVVNGDDGSVIGTISGGGAADAAPVGGPVPDGVFPNLAPAEAPIHDSAAAALQLTTAAGAVAVVGLVASFFF